MGTTAPWGPSLSSASGRRCVQAGHRPPSLAQSQPLSLDATCATGKPGLIRTDLPMNIQVLGRRWARPADAMLLTRVLNVSEQRKPLAATAPPVHIYGDNCVSAAFVVFSRKHLLFRGAASGL